MSIAIRQLERLESVEAAVVDAFLEDYSFPLLEGTTATFVWRGQADRVRLRHFIYGLPSSIRLRRLQNTDLWYVSIELPRGSRIEYKFEVVSNGKRRLLRDPLNPLRAHDPFGSNSVCHGRGYRTPDWTQPDPEARSGTLERLTLASQAFGEERAIRVYLPPRMRSTRRYPVLIVHDGRDYLRYSSLRTVLDNLIYRLEIAPLVVAMTDSPERLREYADDPRHARFLTEELVPHLESRYPLRAEPAARGLMGASFGAVAALSTAWRFPGFFGRLLLQSGSFAFTDIGRNRRGPVFEPVVEFMNAFRDRPGRPSDRLFLSCGMYESLIYENRSLVPLLQATGMRVRYAEARDGHNWENWRDRLREGLSFLFPGPLLLVYE